jgi:opacity protein-like surface antigen
MRFGVGGMKRLVIASILMVGLGCGAQAQGPREYSPNDFIPGSPAYWNWSGFYVGGQFGVSSANFDPGKATQPMVANLLRLTTIEQEAQVSSWPNLPKSSSTGTNYGFFFGYNSQWDDILLGVEFAYNFGANMSAQANDLIARSFSASDGYLYNVSVNSRAAMDFKDFGTIRGRAGYVMGRFLPYAQLGVAIGRADLRRSVTVNLTGTDADPGAPPPLPNVAFNGSASDGKKDAFVYGITAGVGVDIAVTENIFLRAEYEFIQFFQAQSMTVALNTGRLGVGVKF